MSPEQYWLVFDRLGLNLFAVLATGLGLHALLGIADIQRWSRLIVATALLSVVFALGRLAILNAEIAGGMGNAFDLDTLPFAWSSLRDTTLTVVSAALLLGSGVVFGSRWLLGLGSLAMAASFGLTGHSVSAGPNWFAQPAVAVHVLIGGFWLAAPATLYPRRAASDEEFVERLRHFSRIATLAIPVLASLGLTLAWRITGGLAALVSSAYGLLILSKLAVTVLAMGLGALNKLYLTDLLRRQPQQARSMLALTLWAEATLFFPTLVLVTLATTVVPPIGLE